MTADVEQRFASVLAVLYARQLNSSPKDWLEWAEIAEDLDRMRAKFLASDRTPSLRRETFVELEALRNSPNRT